MEFITAIAGDDKKVMQPEIKAFSDVTYHSYRSLGLSFHFVLVPGHEHVLDAIHLYRAPSDRFSTFPKPIVVRRRKAVADSTSTAPSAEGESVATITMDMKGHEVLEKLGEPEKKEGGGRRGNCWIGYQDRYGISIDFSGTDWDNREMPISCLTLAR
ncbi:hypothetical protein BGW42_008658 [Actinomortierella wolfii]|nr:hypothetical protein BGW42_008658 [Actinomortierella wolfii]